MSTARNIVSRVEGGIGWLVFDRPDKRNAVTVAMTINATQIIEKFAQDDGVRVIIVTGAGDEAFVSGADISEFEDRQHDAASAAEYYLKTDQMYHALRSADKPTIAMIHGYCMGGGVALAACCDLRLCSEEAVFAITAARLGLAYPTHMVEAVLQVIGPAFTKELLFTGQRFTAADVARMGLVNRIVAKDELEPLTRDVAGIIAANAPLSVKAAKITVSELLKDSAQRDLARCRQWVETCADSEDYASGRRAFMAKRKPVFVGR